jgi:uncharacterized protein YkwD
MKLSIVLAGFVLSQTTTTAIDASSSTTTTPTTTTTTAATTTTTTPSIPKPSVSGMCLAKNRKPVEPPKPPPRPQEQRVSNLPQVAPVAGDSDGCIRKHNQVRAGLGLPPLAWDAALARSANNWAYRLYSRNSGLVHSS